MHSPPARPRHHNSSAASLCTLSQQLLDLTHRRWAEREDDGKDIGDVHPLSAAVHINIKFYSVGFPDPAPDQFPDLLTAIAALLARRHPNNNVPLLHTAWTLQEVITQEYRILGSVNCEPGIHTPTDWIYILERRFFLWCQQQKQPLGSQRPLLALVLPTCLLEVLKILLTHTFSSSHSLCTPDPDMWEARHGSSRAPSGSVSKWLESA